LTAWGINNQGGIVLTVAADNGNRVEFDSRVYGHVDHGYALSVHKSQGQTIDNVLVLVSESMTDKQWGYVAASRHRKELRVFVPTELQDELAPMLARSRQKEVALDYEPSQTLAQVGLKQVRQVRQGQQAAIEREGELEL
jgi:ATP-dependent exoDNAse (exonuclease V) alpha subunit